MSKLKAPNCPHCDREVEIQGVETPVVVHRCGANYDHVSIVRLDIWMSRPIEAALQSRIAELEAQLADWQDNQRTIMQEKCPTDEVHCTCVPTLRKALEEANEDAERLSFKLQEYADADDGASLENFGTFTEPYKFISEVMEAHRARIQGKDGKG